MDKCASKACSLNRQIGVPDDAVWGPASLLPLSYAAGCLNVNKDQYHCTKGILHAISAKTHKPTHHIHLYCNLMNKYSPIYDIGLTLPKYCPVMPPGE